MNKMIAFCGLTCTECPAFIATQKDDDKEREKVAKLWTKQFNFNFKVEDINCDGCLSEGNRLINYCQTCKTRKCAKEKEIKNCAYCDDYACEILNEVLNDVPEAKIALEEIRKNL